MALAAQAAGRPSTAERGSTWPTNKRKRRRNTAGGTEGPRRCARQLGHLRGRDRPESHTGGESEPAPVHRRGLGSGVLKPSRTKADGPLGAGKRDGRLLLRFLPPALKPRWGPSGCPLRPERPRISSRSTGPGRAQPFPAPCQARHSAAPEGPCMSPWERDRCAAGPVPSVTRPCCGRSSRPLRPRFPPRHGATADIAAVPRDGRGPRCRGLHDPPDCTRPAPLLLDLLNQRHAVAAQPRPVASSFAPFPSRCVRPIPASAPPCTPGVCASSRRP